MYKNALYRVAENRPIAREVFRMRLLGDTADHGPRTVRERARGRVLPAPSDQRLRLGRRRAHPRLQGGGGRGRACCPRALPGETLDLLTGLGNGYDPSAARGRRTVLIGGGVGVPPLYGLARRLALAGEPPAAALGFQTAADAFLAESFLTLGCEVLVATADGSLGERGFVTEPLSRLDYGYYFACGPEPMLAAVHALGREKGAEGQLSFERRMGWRVARLHELLLRNARGPPGASASRGRCSGQGRCGSDGHFGKARGAYPSEPGHPGERDLRVWP